MKGHHDSRFQTESSQQKTFGETETLIPEMNTTAAPNHLNPKNLDQSQQRTGNDFDQSQPTTGHHVFNINTHVNLSNGNVHQNAINGIRTPSPV